jgi:anoctamin-7
VQEIGLSFLIKAGVFTAAYPLHDGELDDRINANKLPLRPWLGQAWACYGRMFKFQPLPEIRTYFGEKMAMYFAWLGFYTCMLVPLALMGVLVIAGGASSALNNVIVNDFCTTNVSNTIMCRNCGARICPYSVCGYFMQIYVKVICAATERVLYEHGNHGRLQ